MRRYTLVCHNYLGNNYYQISFRRIKCKPEDLETRMKDVRRDNPHFAIEGWPEIRYPNSEIYFNTNKILEDTKT